jgi:phospholipid transport system transporter-binding protein
LLLLPASIDVNDARDALHMLAQSLKREPATEAVIDASALQQFDSSALAVLLECQRLAQASGRSFVVRGAPAKLGQLAQLYGMDELLLPAPVVTSVATSAATTA